VGLLDRLPHTRLEPGGPALIDDAIAWFDLRVVSVHPAATHLLIVGRVTATSATARWSARPLVRWRSEYES
jgi:flavin reductase (DIM6/NTAB) family NADH-FMN oxidoreductase RutF